jgi:lipopolysaccharide exporter
METIIEDSPNIPDHKQRKSYAGDIFKMVTGNSIAQIIAVLSSPLLTRIFSPDAFGLMTLFISIIGIVKVVSCLRYEMAIVLPESDDEAVNILGGSILIVIGVTTISLVLLAFVGTPLLILFNAIELKAFLWIMPFSIFSGGIFLALSYWFTRTRKFSQLSLIQVVNSFTTYGSQLLLGIIGFATSGSLIYAYVFGSYLVIIIMGIQIWNIDSPLIRKYVRIDKIIQQLGRYRKFPLYDSIAALLNNISWQLPAFILAAFFSKTEVGYYALSFRLMSMPMSLVGNSIGQVFFQRAAAAKNSGTLAQVVENNYRYLVVLGLLPFVILTFIGKDYFCLYLELDGGKLVFTHKF